jgi:glycosyltransferase involved in cell wall biosynthesis
MDPAKKKIIIIGSAHPLRGGLASFNERLAKEFQDTSHDVTIYTYSLQYPDFIFPGTTQYSAEPPPAGIKIKVAINAINPFNWVSVGNRIRKEKPDIIVVRYWLPLMGPCLGSILRMVKKNRHTKIICIADNIIPHEKRPGDYIFTKYFMKPVDAFITMSEKVLADLRKINTHAPAVKVVHPLYDNFGPIISKEEARHKLGLEKDSKIILFFGFIRKYKGLDTLLDAMQILKSGPNSPLLLVAGEFYEKRQPYDKQIAALGIKENVILRTEFVADSEVKYYLCAADVVVQPYRSATQSGVTPLAYHFEVPMIVTNVGGLPSMVVENKTGLIAEPNAHSLADKINEFFEKGKEFYVPNLRIEKTKYSWQVMTDAILHLAK